MNTRIDTIAHRYQRYDTCGDWRFSFGNLRVTVSRLDNEDYEFLIGLHEMIEAYLCLKAGISQQSVDEFDTSFAGDGEPGDDSRAPYWQQHRFATHIERQVAVILNVDWDDYSNAVAALSPAPPVQPSPKATPSEGNTR